MSKPLSALVLISTAALVACSDATIENMVPGGSISTGALECWLTLQFDALPNGVDPKDVKVRFHSIALDGEPEFDWSFIAGRDVTAGGGKFGSGNRPNDATTAQTDPPLGQPLKVKFPLEAKPEIHIVGDSVWLHADLYWGGTKQDSIKRDIQRLYTAEGQAPWSI
jgi:hypothetical protein